MNRRIRNGVAIRLMMKLENKICRYSTAVVSSYAEGMPLAVVSIEKNDI
jgi:hypothetical protein